MSTEKRPTSQESETERKPRIGKEVWENGIESEGDKGNAASGNKRAKSALRHGIEVLKSFTRKEPVLGVNEISRRVGVHNSTASRILATLEEAHLVERDAPTGKYRLGVGVLALSGPLLANMNVRDVARPYLEQLAESAGETIGLSVWSDGEAINVDQVLGPGAVKHIAHLGARFRPHSSASGKTFMAYDVPEGVDEILSRGLPRLTERTIVDRDALMEDLRRVRRRGYAVNDGEASLETVGIAAPVRDGRTRVVAAVTLSAPRYRTPPERIARLGPLVKETAAEVSKRLGYVWLDM